MSAGLPARVDPAQVRDVMHEAMARYLAARQAFADVHAEYRRSGLYSPVDAEFMAKRDPRVRTAMSDEAFYGNEVRTCSAFLSADWLDPSCAPEGAWPGVAR